MADVFQAPHPIASRQRLAAAARTSLLTLPLLLGACSSGWEDVTDFFAPSAKPASEPADNRTPGTEPRKSRLDRDLVMASGLSARGDREAALQAWIGLRTLYPSEPRVAVGLGEAYLAMNQARDAAAQFEAVLAVDPGHGAALSGMGRAMVKAERATEALPVLDRAIVQAPWDVKAWNARGVALDMQNRHPEAQSSYRAGLGIEPDNAVLLNNLGLSLALAGRVDEAIALLEPAAATGNDPRTRQTLSLVYGLKGEDERAADIAREDLSEDGVEQNMRVFRLLREEEG